MVGADCPSDSKHCRNVFVIRAAPLTVRARRNEKFLMQILFERVLTFNRENKKCYVVVSICDEKLRTRPKRCEPKT